jgi:UDP-N-acetyl-D-galactosamine dehydrogenase
MALTTHNRKVSVIGLGYVGLPVAAAFGKSAPCVGFDIQQERIAELREFHDRTGEMTRAELQDSQVLYTANPEDLRKADFHIVAVPTPIDDAHQPDLTPVLRASETVGRILKKGDIVVYESTVYPGVTEEVAVPILEKLSGLKCGTDFTVGYSPERINPGDKEKTFTKILKVVSGQDAKTLEIVANVYGSVVTAGTHRAPSIRVAEAAKVIENTQRDLNIALMNELAMIFEKMNIDTHDVLTAAGTKWNFLKFTPGLVGGHCIGVDPYYLTHKAEKMGYIPQVILAGRRINDGMGKFIAQKAIKEVILAKQNVLGMKALVLGLTFKENCPDIRNSKVPDIISELREFGVDVTVHDPRATARDAEEHYGLKLKTWDEVRAQKYELIILAVAHNEFRALDVEQLQGLAGTNPVMIDVKAFFPPSAFGSKSGFRYWRL